MAVDQQRYRVLERLAAGGMAEVYLAESAGLEGFKKRVAIKRVLPHLSEKTRFIAMFLDEARLSAHLNHSNIAHVFDIGVGDNAYFIVMEYVDGVDLKAIVTDLSDKKRKFPIESAIFIASKICEGLSYAHELKSPEGQKLSMVHRDVSPPNVLVSRQGEIKIVDFGLAKASTQLERSEAGIIKGKFGYLAPESAHGLEVDARADIFAVGIMLWELLAGRRLFHGKTDYETVKQVQAAVVPPIGGINRDAADPELGRILARALAADREDRYPTARDLGRDLTRFLYRLGRPVDAFDIADLVRGALRSRARKTLGDTASVIDRLIAESLLEFTSLLDTSGGGHEPDPEMRAPLSLDEFGNINDFQVAVDHQQAAELVRNTLHDVFEEGNLAALEGPDEPLPPASRSSRAPRSGPPGPASVPQSAAAIDSGSRERGDGLASSGSFAAASKRGSGYPPASQPAPSWATASQPPPSQPVPSPGSNSQAPPPPASLSEAPESSRGATATIYVMLVLIAAATATAVWYAGLVG